MKTLFKNLFLFLIIGSISGCMMAQHRGNGNVISKTYELSSFDRISASGSFSVILTQSGEQHGGVGVLLVHVFFGQVALLDLA